MLILHQEVGLKLFTFGLSLIFGLSAFMIAACDLSIFSGQDNKKEKTRHGSQKIKNEKKPVNKWSLFQYFMTPDQLWLILFVFMYKVGEQGFASMYPLFLIDRGLPMSHIGMITGIFGQICSMLGSTLGGILISKFG